MIIQRMLSKQLTIFEIYAQMEPNLGLQHDHIRQITRNSKDNFLLYAKHIPGKYASRTHLFHRKEPLKPSKGIKHGIN